MRNWNVNREVVNFMNKEQLVNKMKDEYGRVIVKDNGNKILAAPFKFYTEDGMYVITENVERTGNIELLKTSDEDKACRYFWNILHRN